MNDRPRLQAKIAMRKLKTDINQNLDIRIHWLLWRQINNSEMKFNKWVTYIFVKTSRNSRK